MTQRTRPGIATTYRGIRFRSRLEAKWALFFDLVEWRWEYEPFDANGYIPDFVLLHDDPVLVEIKPAITPDGFATATTKAYDALAGHWTHDILFLGVTPFFTTSDCWNRDWTGLGLLGEHEPTCDGDGTWWTGVAMWNECGHCGRIGFFHDFQSYRSRLCGHYSGDHYINQPSDLEMAELAAKWTHATNINQWRRQ